jgi:hypothetical protein
METKIHGHHFLIALLIVFVGIQLARANFLGVPALVMSLTQTVLNALGPITSQINVGQITGTSGQ